MTTRSFRLTTKTVSGRFKLVLVSAIALLAYSPGAALAAEQRPEPVPYYANPAAKPFVDAWANAVASGDVTGAAQWGAFLRSISAMAAPHVFELTQAPQHAVYKPAADLILDFASADPRSIPWLLRLLDHHDFTILEKVITRLRNLQGQDLWHLDACTAEPVVRALVDGRSEQLKGAARLLLADARTNRAAAVPYLITLLDFRQVEKRIESPQRRLERFDTVISLLGDYGSGGRRGAARPAAHLT
jgi:hypothetical protein